MNTRDIIECIVIPMLNSDDSGVSDTAGQIIRELRERCYLLPAQDYRMEAIRAWATAARYAYANSQVSHAAQKDLLYSLDRIIDMAGEQ